MSLMQVVEIKSRFEHYINREKWVQNSLSQLRQKITMSKRPNPASSLLPDVAGIIAREVFRVPRSGKYARKIARSMMSNQSPQFQSQELGLAVQHDSIVHEICTFLESISAKKSGLFEPNSHLLIQKIKSAQSYSKLETRIRRTIVALEIISTLPLIYNKGIQTVAFKKKELAESLSNLPRLTILRREIPEVEPSFKDFLRRNMGIVYGHFWQNKIQTKFSNSFAKWQDRLARHGGKDILDAMQFGELLSILNSFPAVRTYLKDTQAVNLALSIIQNERAILIHPIERTEEDVDQARFAKIQLAISTLKSSF